MKMKEKEDVDVKFSFFHESTNFFLWVVYINYGD